MYSLQWNERDYGIAMKNDGRFEMATDTALEMLKDKEPIEKIIKYSHLSKERINELARQLQ